ncbi:MAG TPA: hypothetical protein ENI07_01115 [Desulfobacterales bacterium]|nr:hypothetical protein [Desulfobacterales bacterium]
MSIVCCKILDDTIEIASDSITVRGWTQDKGRNNMAKLCDVNGMLIGGIGAAAETSLLQIFCHTHQPASSGESDIVTLFVEFAEWKKKKTDKYEMENTYIFIFDGLAFFINSFFVNKITTYEAIGVGQEFALAALYLGHNVEQAVAAACELCTMCEKPIKMLTVPRKK